MNATTKTDWLIALRSGEYRQGKYVLRNQWKDSFEDPKDPSCYEYCPLGLLCHITGYKETSWYGTYPNVKRDGLNLSEKILPFEGISPDDQMKIGQMNDSGQSFNQVADWIEKHL